MSDTEPNANPPKNIPPHIAIIMDGNGRWAERRGLMRVEGHRQGAETVGQIAEECERLGVERLTLYAFSLENWKRPKAEVSTLMTLLKKFLIEKREEMKDRSVRFSAIGRLRLLPSDTYAELMRTIESTSQNTGLNICLALSYGARAELVDAARGLAEKAARGEIRPEEIDEELFAKHLYQPGRDPDLLIRTAGEMRLSNFLLWQISYSELFVSELCWPEFTVDEFHRALHAYEARTRKFGGLKPASQ